MKTIVDYNELPTRQERFAKAAWDVRKYLGCAQTVKVRKVIKQVYRAKGAREARNYVSLAGMLNGFEGYYPVSGFWRHCIEECHLEDNAELLEALARKVC